MRDVVVSAARENPLSRAEYSAARGTRLTPLIAAQVPLIPATLS